MAIIINALVFNKLFYCSKFWSNTSDRKIGSKTAIISNKERCFAFKCMTGCVPDYLTSMLVTRGQVTGRVSFQYTVVSLWNSLSKDLKLSKNHRDYKRKLRQIL